jgi:chromosome segregation ATPase
MSDGLNDSKIIGYVKRPQAEPQVTVPDKRIDYEVFRTLIRHKISEEWAKDFDKLIERLGAAEQQNTVLRIANDDWKEKAAIIDKQFEDILVERDRLKAELEAAEQRAEYYDQQLNIRVDQLTATETERDRLKEQLNKKHYKPDMEDRS